MKSSKNSRPEKSADGSAALRLVGPVDEPRAGAAAPLSRAPSDQEIAETARVLLGILDPIELSAVASMRTCRLLGAEGAALLRVEEPSGELCLEAPGEEKGSEPQRTRFAPGLGIAGWVAEHGTPALVPEAGADARFSPEVDRCEGAPARSVVAVPLIVERRVCGVLAAFNPVEAPAGFDEHHLKTLRALAPQVALAVKNSRVAAELVRARAAAQSEAEELEDRVRERTAQLARAKRDWERTFDAIGDPLVIVEDGAVRRANLAAATLGRQDIRAVVGARCHQLLAGRADPCPGCPLSGESDGGEVTLRGRVFRANGYALEGGGTVIHYRDVTEERRLQARLRDSEKMASVGQLASGAAHEINNPLGFLLSNLNTLELTLRDVAEAFARVDFLQYLAGQGDGVEAVEQLREGVITEQAREALGEAPEMLLESREGAQRIHRIVRALKELTTEGRCSRARENPWDTLERALRRAGIPAERVTVAGRAEVQIAVEPQQLEIAFANVLRNAVQASPEEAPIQVGTFVDDGKLLVVVADRGCGMSPEVRARAFDPFFTTRPVGQGLGLGLTAAYGTVARHGGTIEIESEPGVGTEVRIRLPLD